MKGIPPVISRRGSDEKSLIIMKLDAYSLVIKIKTEPILKIK